MKFDEACNIFCEKTDEEYIFSLEAYLNEYSDIPWEDIKISDFTYKNKPYKQLKVKFNRKRTDVNDIHELAYFMEFDRKASVDKKLKGVKKLINIDYDEESIIIDFATK